MNVDIRLRRVKMTDIRIAIPAQNSIVQKLSAKSSRRMDVVTAAELKSTLSSAPNKSDMNTIEDANLCVMYDRS